MLQYSHIDAFWETQRFYIGRTYGTFLELVSAFYHRDKSRRYKIGRAYRHWALTKFLWFQRIKQ